MVANEGRTLARSVFRMLQGAFPFHDRPTGEVILGQLAEDAAEVNLAISQGTKAPRPVDPILVSAIDTGSTRRIKLGVLHVEGTDALMVDVEEGEVVELLQYEVAGIVQNICPWMGADCCQEALEGDSVVKIFARMIFETEIYA